MPNLDARPKASASTANSILCPDPLDQRLVAYAAALTLGAKGQYVYWAMKKLDQADARGLIGKERQDYLRHTGGVSVVAGILAGLLVATHYGLAVYGTYLMATGMVP